jgi:AmiR/NasT family two-component response regulator
VGRGQNLREPGHGVRRIPRYSVRVSSGKGPVLPCPNMSEHAERLRILVSDGPGTRLDEVSRTVASLGHDVIARESSLPEVGRITSVERPDVALVIVHEGTAKGLELIDRIVHEAACPVIAVLDVEDRDFINEAAKHGIFAYIADGDDPQEMQSAIDIVLRRFAEYHDLEGAFARRAVTERAKGILMERHGIDEHAAFDMLRDHARRTHRKVVDLAEAVVAGHPMLPAQPARRGEPQQPAPNS